MPAITAPTEIASNVTLLPGSYAIGHGRRQFLTELCSTTSHNVGVHWSNSINHISPEAAIDLAGDNPVDLVLLVNGSARPAHSGYADSAYCRAYVRGTGDTVYDEGGNPVRFLIDGWHSNLNITPHPLPPIRVSTESNDYWLDGYSRPAHFGHFAERVIYLSFVPDTEPLSNPRLVEALHHSLEPIFDLVVDDDPVAAWQEEQLRQTAESLSTVNFGRRASRISELEQTIRGNVAQREEFRQRIEAIGTRIDLASAELKGIIENPPEPPPSVDDLFNELLTVNNHSKVTHVEPDPRNNGVITVRTKDLDLNVEYDGTHYHTVTGPYTIRFDFTNNTVSIPTNDTTPHDDYQHPHVSAGTFCLGRTHTLVTRLLQKRELYNLVNVVIDQLEQVNPADTYWSRWFEFFGDDLEQHMYDNNDHPDNYED